MIELKHEGGQKWNVTGQTPSIAIRPCGRRRMQMHSICSLAEQKGPPSFLLCLLRYSHHISILYIYLLPLNKTDYAVIPFFFFPSRFLPPLPTSLSSVRRPWNSPHLAKIKDVYRKKKRDEELFLSNSGKTPRSMVSNGKMHKRLFLVFSLCLSAKEKRTKSAREKRLTASRCLLVRRECSPNSSSSRRRSTAQLPEWKAAKRRGEVYIDEAISTSTNSVLTILEKHTPKNCVCVYSTLYFGLPFYFNYFDFLGCQP